uniref:Laccase n=1 Tax=Fagus sylvatica TaxID=28930 RepID=A0A2N9IPE6_FAGSY
MARFVALLACALALLATSMASAAIVEHSFSVQNLTVRRLCNEQVITAVNGSLPGPTIRVREGDILVVHVFNKSPYNITIHWHGIFQLLSGWADGPEYVTQCPILPGNSYIYKFKITGQEGTLWWHAHSAWLRATVHGALIIHPKSGRSYPFPKPHKEVPILLGEWWNANVVDVENEGLASGGAPNNSDAYTINGKPGDLYQCSQNLAPGQTTDVLVTADQTVGSYYMAATPYASAVGVLFDDTITRGIIEYEGATSATPLMPVLPATNDTSTAHKFFTNLTGLAGGPHWVPVPRDIDEHMFVTFGLNLAPCGREWIKCHVVVPSNSTMSMLQAFFYDVSGVYTTDFPSKPPVKFDYTNPNISLDESLIYAPKATKVKKLKYNSTVEIVLQNTAFVGIENHPIHLHGFNFHVLAQGFGNYDSVNDQEKFNLVNPQARNTIAVPVGGWAVIRFQANNPGIWLAHCHLDVHLPWGLAMAFEVENGPTLSSTLPPPPIDLPQC